MRIWIVAIAVGLVVAPRAARAQDNVCTPACRSGFVCNQGTCISACNPVCSNTEVCTNAGECVSKCNPVCGPNETCGADGQCHGTFVAPPPTPSIPPTHGSSGFPGAPMPGNEGWASTAGMLGIATSVVVAGLVTAIIIVDETDFGVPVGSVATLAVGVMVPVVAKGASSARMTPGVTGASGLRLTGWIFYGLSIADALALLGLAVSGADIPPAVTSSVGLLGTASAVFMSLDAFQSAKQARASAPSFQMTARPYIGALRDANQQTVATAGLAWSF